jgi:hypothetical protein
VMLNSPKKSWGRGWPSIAETTTIEAAPALLILHKLALRRDFEDHAMAVGASALCRAVEIPRTVFDQP